MTARTTWTAPCSQLTVDVATSSSLSSSETPALLIHQLLPQDLTSMTLDHDLVSLPQSSPGPDSPSWFSPWRSSQGSIFPGHMEGRRGRWLILMLRQGINIMHVQFGTDGFKQNWLIKVRIRGHPDDFNEPDNQIETEAVRKNGFNPAWKQSFVFNIKVPDVAFLEFKVKISYVLNI